jgi:hypothetical protein
VNTIDGSAELEGRVQQVNPSQSDPGILDQSSGTRRLHIAGEFQADEFRRHNHVRRREGHPSVPEHSSGVTGTNGPVGVDQYYGIQMSGQNPQAGAYTLFEAQGGDETRPKNIAVYYYIRIN